MKKEYTVTKNVLIPIAKYPLTTADTIVRLDVLQDYGWQAKSITPTKQSSGGHWMHCDVVWEREFILIDNLIGCNTFYTLCCNINAMEISVRLQNRLFELFYLKKPNEQFPDINKRIYELVSFQERDLIKIKGFGKRCLDELNEWLSHSKLHLGMKLSREVLVEIHRKIK